MTIREVSCTVCKGTHVEIKAWVKHDPRLGFVVSALDARLGRDTFLRKQGWTCWDCGQEVEVTW